MISFLLSTFDRVETAVLSLSFILCFMFIIMYLLIDSRVEIDGFMYLLIDSRVEIDGFIMYLLIDSRVEIDGFMYLLIDSRVEIDGFN